MSIDADDGKAGKFPGVRSIGGHRYFRSADIDNFLRDIVAQAKQWASGTSPIEPPGDVYCQTADIFQARLSRFERSLGAIPDLKNTFTLISSVTGEVGNNSFDHNIGNWPDIPGIFFGYDLARRYLVLADRGQGVLKRSSGTASTLNDTEAIAVAFTKIISPRAANTGWPEICPACGCGAAAGTHIYFGNAHYVKERPAF